jgi:UDP-glucose:tetrahydrobiopterin glucosyltransferase
MKIAVLAHLHFPIREPYDGGMEAHTAELVHELQRQGHRVTLYARAGSDPSLNVISILNKDDKAGQNVQLKAAYKWAINHIKAHHYDVVINNTLDSLPLEIIGKTNISMLTIFHSPSMWEVLELPHATLTAPNLCYAAVSKGTAADWRKEGNLPVNVVYNGIDAKHWQPVTSQEKENYIAWAGRITPEKGTDLAIKTAVRLGMPIKIAGGMYDPHYFNTAVKPLLSSGVVEYVNKISGTELSNFYAKAKVALVTPLWNEPFGLVAIEALLCGTPVAAINNGAMKEIITDKVGALAKEATVDGLVAAVKEALTKDSQTCRQYVENTFTLEKMVSHYLDILEDVMFDDTPEFVTGNAQLV